MFCEAWDEAFRLELIRSIGSTGGVKLAVLSLSRTVSETLRVGTGEPSCTAESLFDMLTSAPAGPVGADFDFSMATPTIAVARKIARNNAIFFIVIKDSSSVDSLILP